MIFHPFNKSLTIPMKPTHAPKTVLHLEIQDGATPTSTFYKDVLRKIHAVPVGKSATSYQAAEQLFTLRKKARELQLRRQRLWNGYVVRTCAVGMDGKGFVVSKDIAVYRNDTVKDVKKAVVEVFAQINALRDVYTEEDGCEIAKGGFRPDQSNFQDGLGRKELQGQL